MDDRLRPPAPPLAPLLLGPYAATAPAGLEQALQEAWSACERAWPDVRLEAADFIPSLRRRLSGGDLLQELQRLHLTDLYLAYGCFRAVPAALAAFDSAILENAVQAVRRLDATNDFVDEVKQQLRERLLLSKADKPPRILEYAGRGPLLLWARAAAMRVGLNAHRGRQPMATSGALEELPAAATPELELLREKYRAEFAKAFRVALAQLSPRDRTLLRLNVLEGLSVDRIAPAYGVHRATVARWIAAARAQLLDATQAELSKHLKLSEREMESLWGLVVSRLDLSLQGLLRPEEEA